MKNSLLITTVVLLAATPLGAQEFSPTRSITAFTEIADDYYNEFTTVTDLQELETSSPDFWDEDAAAEVGAKGLLRHKDGQGAGNEHADEQRQADILGEGDESVFHGAP